MSESTARADEVSPYRYNARLANEIEQRWQDRWEKERTFWTPNPTGPLADGYERVADRSKLYVLDMFPYPSGAGLHVGHPLGYIGTDVYARFQRMTGHNVLHAMGYDAFGLPAEQYALETGQHPRVTTDQNIATMRRQLRRLGLGHDPRRGVSTTDVHYYRWTQWIFLQMFNAWYDGEEDKAWPISTCSTGPSPSRSCSATGSGAARAPTSRSRSRVTTILPSVCSRPAPTPCSAPPTWCWHRSSTSSTRSSPTNGRVKPRSSGEGRSASTCRRPRPSRRTATSRRRRPTSSVRPKAGRRPASSSARTPSTPS